MWCGMQVNQTEIDTLREIANAMAQKTKVFERQTAAFHRKWPSEPVVPAKPDGHPAKASFKRYQADMDAYYAAKEMYIVDYCEFVRMHQTYLGINALDKAAYASAKASYFESEALWKRIN